MFHNPTNYIHIKETWDLPHFRVHSQNILIKIIFQTQTGVCENTNIIYNYNSLVSKNMQISCLILYTHITLELKF